MMDILLGVMPGHHLLRRLLVPIFIIVMGQTTH